MQKKVERNPGDQSDSSKSGYLRSSSPMSASTVMPFERRRLKSESKSEFSGASRSGRQEHKDHKFAALPIDLLKMVNSVLDETFAGDLEKIRSTYPGEFSKIQFESRGYIFPDEILLAVTLVQPGKIAANTILASADYNPNADLSLARSQEIVHFLLDQIGAFLDDQLRSNESQDGKTNANTDLLSQAAAAIADSKLGTPILGALGGDSPDDYVTGNKLERFLSDTLGAMLNAPFDWSATKADEKTVVYLKVEKTNPSLEEAAELWLLNNDPALKQDAEVTSFAESIEGTSFFQERVKNLDLEKSKTLH